jgi:hypothetical protein
MGMLDEGRRSWWFEGQGKGKCEEHGKRGRVLWENTLCGKGAVVES